MSQGVALEIAYPLGLLDSYFPSWVFDPRARIWFASIGAVDFWSVVPFGTGAESFCPAVKRRSARSLFVDRIEWGTGWGPAWEL